MSSIAARSTTFRTHARGGARRAGASRTRLTVRGRRLVLLMALVLVAVVAVLGRPESSQAVQGLEVRPTLTQVTVQDGDTLWSVARQVAPQRDAREVVGQLRRLNHLTSSNLHVGQQLLLPEAV